MSDLDAEEMDPTGDDVVTYEGGRCNELVFSGSTFSEGAIKVRCRTQAIQKGGATKTAVRD